MFFKTKTKPIHNPEETIELSSDETVILKEVDEILNSFKKPEETKKNIITYDDLRQQVRELAYKKSEEAGHPWGRDKEFWIEAEKELFGEDALKCGGYYVKQNGSYILVCPINSEIPVEIDQNG